MTLSHQQGCDTLVDPPMPGQFGVTIPETRITDPRTGGSKGKKLAQFSLIPSRPLMALAEHYGKGAQKYAEPRNWERGYAWDLSFDAMQRHAWLWWGGEDLDSETGSNHLTAVAWHSFALLEWSYTHPELDSRSHG